MARRKPTADGAPGPHPPVHGHGDEARLDAILSFVAFAARSMPLSTLLDDAPRHVAAIVSADVVSLYLLEGHGDELVLRGNVGFPERARGTVRLAVGEGITGRVVESLRPVSTPGAPYHLGFRYFPELSEEQFPIYLGVPIVGPQGPLGALVAQRRAGGTPFASTDRELLVALTAPIAAGIRHAHLLDELRDRAQRRGVGGGTRKVTLPGVPVVPGRSLGALAALRRPAHGTRAPAREDDARRLRVAFDHAEKALAGLVSRAHRLGLGDDATFLLTYLQIASDARLRQRALELCASGRGVAPALDAVAGEAARAASGATGDPFLAERARDIEDLCDALVMLAAGDARAEVPVKSVIAGDQLTVFDVLVTARFQPVGVALTERASGPRARVLLRLLGVPAIVDVVGIFRWGSPRDVVLLDADHGFLVINPSRAEIAALRAARREPASHAGRREPVPAE